MKTQLPAKWMCVAVIALSLCSCASNKIRPVTDAQIDRLSPGMSLEEVKAICGPNMMPTSYPVGLYSSKTGGRYVVYFFPTNEVPEYIGKSDSSLVAVTKQNEYSADYTQGGVYLLPRRLRGKICTGFSSRLFAQ